MVERMITRCPFYWTFPSYDSAYITVRNANAKTETQGAASDTGASDKGASDAGDGTKTV